jgi:selenocysteine lyase/cysteine desulfurase
VRLHTSLKKQFSCGIGTVQVEGLDSEKLVDWLWEKRRVLVTGIKHPEFEGVRVTPSVYTTMEEIERFCGAMEEAIERGV